MVKALVSWCMEVWILISQYMVSVVTMVLQDVVVSMHLVHELILEVAILGISHGLLFSCRWPHDYRMFWLAMMGFVVLVVATFHVHRLMFI